MAGALRKWQSFSAAKQDQAATAVAKGNSEKLRFGMKYVMGT